MRRSTCMVLVGLAVFAVARTGWADDAALQALRSELQALRNATERRIAEMERRLGEAQSEIGRLRTAREGASVPVADPVAAATTEDKKPHAGVEVEFVLSGTYAAMRRDPATYEITGFVPRGNGASPGARGLRLTESSVGFEARLSPKLEGRLFLSVDRSDRVVLEEAKLETGDLGRGVRATVGRFFSEIGYQNRLHQHDWDFADAPLIYRALWGDNYVDDGLKLSWSPHEGRGPRLGFELGRGRNALGADRDRNGANTAVLFAHYAGQLGTAGKYRLGASLLATSTRGPGTEIRDTDARGIEVINRFHGNIRVAGLDFHSQWGARGPLGAPVVSLQGEYFRTRHAGDLAYDTTAVALGPVDSSHEATRSGAYVQAVWQFIPAWRVGLRYDRLSSGQQSVGPANAANVVLRSHRPDRASLMLDYELEEASRIRLQFNRDRARLGAPDTQFFVQYVVTFGGEAPANR